MYCAFILVCLEETWREVNQVSQTVYSSCMAIAAVFFRFLKFIDVSVLLLLSKVSEA